MMSESEALRPLFFGSTATSPIHEPVERLDVSLRVIYCWGSGRPITMRPKRFIDPSRDALMGAALISFVSKPKVGSPDFTSGATTAFLWSLVNVLSLKAILRLNKAFIPT